VDTNKLGLVLPIFQEIWRILESISSFLTDKAVTQKPPSEMYAIQQNGITNALTKSNCENY